MHYAKWLGLLLGLSVAGNSLALPIRTSQFYDVTADQTHYDRQQQRVTFTGHVIAKRPDSVIRGDQLVLYLNAQQQLQKLICTGQLAHFTMRFTEKPHLLQGAAKRITYDLNQQVTWFTGDALVTRGEHRLSGPRLRYHLTDNTLQATGSRQQQTRIILQPHDVETTS